MQTKKTSFLHEYWKSLDHSTLTEHTCVYMYVYVCMRQYTYKYIVIRIDIYSIQSFHFYLPKDRSSKTSATFQDVKNGPGERRRATERNNKHI